MLLRKVQTVVDDPSAWTHSSATGSSLAWPFSASVTYNPMRVVMWERNISTRITCVMKRIPHVGSGTLRPPLTSAPNHETNIVMSMSLWTTTAGTVTPEVSHVGRDLGVMSLLDLADCLVDGAGILSSLTPVALARCLRDLERLRVTYFVCNSTPFLLL